VAAAATSRAVTLRIEWRLRTRSGGAADARLGEGTVRGCTRDAKSLLQSLLQKCSRLTLRNSEPTNFGKRPGLAGKQKTFRPTQSRTWLTKELRGLSNMDRIAKQLGPLGNWTWPARTLASTQLVQRASLRAGGCRTGLKGWAA
jgi:hypothetical protein